MVIKVLLLKTKKNKSGRGKNFNYKTEKKIRRLFLSLLMKNYQKQQQHKNCSFKDLNKQKINI